MDGEYLLLARGEKDRTYGVMGTWTGRCFLDDMGLEYRFNDIVAFADFNLVDRPPFESTNPLGLRTRFVNKRRYKGL